MAILVFTVPVSICFSWLYVKISLHKHEIQERILQGMADNDLILLKFSKQEIYDLLHWEHEKEFEFNDNKYDIVRITEQGDSIFYWCFPDDHETFLSKKLSLLIERVFHSEKEDQQQKTQFDRFFKSLCIETHTGSEDLISYPYRMHNFCYSFQFEMFIKGLDTPPPKII